MHLLNSHTAHTLKDLEKILPANVPSLHAMAVKEHLQTLINEDMIKVEKIGSGNWYWVFGSEEKRRRVQELNGLNEELEKSRKACEVLESQVNARREAQGDGDEENRIKLMDEKEVLNRKVTVLAKELEGYKDNDPGVIRTMQEETESAKQKAERWTDNIDVVQGWLLEKMGGDREQMDNLQREVYGSEYVEGEGLAEL